MIQNGIISHKTKLYHITFSNIQTCIIHNNSYHASLKNPKCILTLTLYRCKYALNLRAPVRVFCSTLIRILIFQNNVL